MDDTQKAIKRIADSVGTLQRFNTTHGFAVIEQECANIRNMLQVLIAPPETYRLNAEETHRWDTDKEFRDELSAAARENARSARVPVSVRTADGCTVLTVIP